MKQKLSLIISYGNMGHSHIFWIFKKNSGDMSVCNAITDSNYLQVQINNFSG